MSVIGVWLERDREMLSFLLKVKEEAHPYHSLIVLVTFSVVRGATDISHKQHNFIQKETPPDGQT